MEFKTRVDHPGFSAVLRQYSNDDDGVVSKKARTIGSEQEDTVEDDVYEEEDITPESSADLCSTFKPLHLPLVWTLPETLTPRISVSIILTSGVEKGGFTLCFMCHQRWFCT